MSDAGEPTDLDRAEARLDRRIGDPPPLMDRPAWRLMVRAAALAIIDAAGTLPDPDEQLRIHAHAEEYAAAAVRAASRLLTEYSPLAAWTTEAIQLRSRE